MNYELKNALKKKGMSQTALSEITGIAQPTISTIVTGKHKPRNATMKKLAQALDMTEAELFKDRITSDEIKRLHARAVDEKRALLIATYHNKKLTILPSGNERTMTVMLAGILAALGDDMEHILNNALMVVDEMEALLNGEAEDIL